MVRNLILLIVTLLTIFVQLYAISRTKKHTYIKTLFLIILYLLLLWLPTLIAQLLVSNLTNINPIYFEYIVYIAACFLPVFILLFTISFTKTEPKFKKKYLALFIVPTITLLVLWTSNFHQLFFIEYNIDLRKTTFGPYFYIHSIYSYGCVAYGIIKMIIYSIKNSGLFSKQSLLFVTGTAFCLFINIVSTFGILNLTIYATPISFTLALVFWGIAIFRLNFLNITPIALQIVVDKISDGYIVLDETNTIVDYNKTLLTMLKTKEANIQNKNILTIAKQIEPNLTPKKLDKLLDKAKNSTKTITTQYYFEKSKKYFTIEITAITSNNAYLGLLILLKDVTQHINDMDALKNSQETLMEQERLATLGQMVGGIAHNLKTPIMSIAGAGEGLQDLITEYEKSIEDPEVTIQDHHEIAQDMREWVGKIKNYTEYMSDIITAVKGQVVTLSNDEIVSFTIDELIKRVNILMKHELKHSLINLNQHINVDSDLTIQGDVNSLVQVLNNLISNAIQSYEGAENQNIDFDFNLSGKKLTISVKDYGKGIPADVQKKLFKEMITTKGKNGTGLGLFMSYSNIKAHFNGTINFESEVGKGTTFNVIIPVK